MALEITSLTIGALALVGTFKDCIDVFGMITSARSLTDDAEVLNTKLDVEKMLLLQWADRVGLTEPTNYDSRLEDSDLNQTTARVLEGIKRLLSDGNALRDRYGLVDYQQVRHKIVLDDRLGITASSARLQRFIERFNRISFQTEVPRREHSVATRFKWVIRDKEKFGSLMNEVSYFVSRLNALVPALAQEQSRRTMTEKDLGKIRSIPQLKVVVKASTGVNLQIAVIAQHMIRSLNQERVLNRLWFRSINDRKMNINERHFRTLDWALDPLEITLKWDNLAEWLRNGTGLYWLAGKAGSGKSTLMKYLSDHPQTMDLLRAWARKSELVTLQYFFYALGMPEQKSQEGMLRSLLFQFLDKQRDSIGQVLPAMWKEAIITEDKDHDLAMPSISEMQTSLLQLLGTVSADKTFWILIDGLDEFEGKHATIAAFLSRLERLANVKVLVSSRPLPLFVSSFDHAPKMCLQDLTYGDIVTYINDTVWHHPYMTQLSRTEPRKIMKIGEVLVSKASGVFLWVVLACQSILEGLEEYDTLPELMNRVTQFPPELSDFFRQIIDGIDPRKRDQSARFLRLVFESQTSSSFSTIPTLGLAIVDEQGLRADFTGQSVTGLSNAERVLRCKTLEGRLRSRCSGLVEIQMDSGINLATPLEPITAAGATIVNSRVVFLHRSLYEYLCTEGIWERDTLRVDNACGMFEPHAILASLWTQLAGLEITLWSYAALSADCYDNAVVHNVCASAANCPPEILATNLARLQGLFTRDRGFLRIWNCAPSRRPRKPERWKGCENLSAGLAIAAEFGMVSLVQLALEDPDEIRFKLRQPEAGQVLDCSRHGTRLAIFPLLYYATCQPFLSLLYKTTTEADRTKLETMVSTGVVKYLLENGHDPNEGFEGNFDGKGGTITTPWIRWLSFIRDEGRTFLGWNSTHFETDFFAELAHRRAVFTKLFVDAGAELGTPGTHMQKLVDNSVSSSIDDTASQSRRRSVAWARSEDLWSQVRDTILSSRAARSHLGADSR